MYKKILFFTLAATLTMGLQVQAQQYADDVYTQRLSYIKTVPGKGQEWRQLVRDVSMKVAQVQADSGEIVSWTLLRSVYPAGQEARADFMISVITKGDPRSRVRSRAENRELAGVKMTTSEYNEKRNALSTLVAAELWRPRIYNGAAENGNYLSLNMMEVKDWDTIGETTQIWSPLSKELIKQGAMTGWIYATKILPSGSETPYAAYTANMYPTYEAAFGSNRMGETFAKIHPDKNIDEYRGKLTKARSIAKRELWAVVERITKSK